LNLPTSFEAFKDSLAVQSKGNEDGRD